MQHLCSRTLKPSHTTSFLDKWTSYLEDFRANPSVMLESVKELKIPGISSHTSETASESAGPELFSSKTLKELSQVKRPMENQFSNMSSENWKDWVTSQRQEYSQRVKSQHPTRESGSSSWGTPSTMDVLPPRSPEALARAKKKGGCKNLREEVKNWQTPTTVDIERTPEGMAKRKAYRESIGRKYVEGCLTEQVKNWPTASVSDPEGGSQADRVEWTESGPKLRKKGKPHMTYGAKLRDAVESHEQNWPTPTTAEGTKIGNQPNYGQVGLSNHPSIVGHPDRAKLKKSGKNQESWLTPRVLEVDEDYENYQKRMQKSGNPKNVGKKNPANLTMQAKSQESWPTPRANKVHPEITDQNREQLANRRKANLEEDVAGHCGKATGKLNPNWVEQLMGLPVGWTDLGSWATESSQLPQPKPSSPSSKG